MYNLNEVNCGPAPEYGKLTITQGESTGGTPKTPEIINSLIAITSPLDDYVKRNNLADDKLFSPSDHISADTCSSTSSNVGSPTSPTSVQNICSQLIKEGLKHTLQKKRRNNLSTSETESNTAPSQLLPVYGTVTRYDESSLDTEEDDGNSLYGDGSGSSNGLTPEDEERRKRRRERNKIAATKCRLKKRERTVNLVQESETLENQNHDLKSQIQELVDQRGRLMNMLTIHKPACVKPSPDNTPVIDYQQPPSFIPSGTSNGVPNNYLYGSGDRERAQLLTTAVLPDVHHNTLFDLTTDAFIRNPSVMLSVADNKSKATQAKQNSSDCSSCKTIPNFSFLDDSGNNNHFDMSYIDNSSSRCIV